MNVVVSALMRASSSNVTLQAQVPTEEFKKPVKKVNTGSMF